MHRILVRLAMMVIAALSLFPTYALASAKDSLAIVQPIAPGPYPVACSNVQQDFSRLLPGETAELYWEGHPDNNRQRYVTTLLVDPADTFVTSFTLPDNHDLFGDYNQQAVTFVLLVCYPTSTSNMDPDYALPNGRSVPRMQRGAELPIFAEDRAQYPVLLFSTGLGGSPLSNDYIDALTLFASYGYVVVAPFPGDPRFADVQLDSFHDVVYAIEHFSNYTAMQAVRPVALSHALDTVLANPSFAARMDQNAVGGFGASLGGESLLLMKGAALTVSVGESSKPVIDDPRLKAAVGYVPYFGQSFLPAFGRDQHGLDNVVMPYLAISGTADTTAPIETTAPGIVRLSGPKQLVALEGVGHGFDQTSSPDIFTWSLVYLGAYVQDNPLMRAESARMIAVSGGGSDSLLIDKSEPLPPDADERLSIEYYNSSLDHYFMTAEPAEAAMLDAGIIVPGWSRTGFEFKVWRSDFTAGLPACRFFGTPGLGPNSHFFTIDPNECALVRANPDWMFEDIAFRSDPPINADCAVDRVPVVRMYNNGKGGQANHRYLTSHSEIVVMLGQGWIVEGPVFCSLP